LRRLIASLFYSSTSAKSVISVVRRLAIEPCNIVKSVTFWADELDPEFAAADFRSLAKRLESEGLETKLERLLHARAGSLFHLVPPLP
jgi:hypothetical protein